MVALRSACLSNRVFSQRAVLIYKHSQSSLYVQTLTIARLYGSHSKDTIFRYRSEKYSVLEGLAGVQKLCAKLAADSFNDLEYICVCQLSCIHTVF